MPGDQLTIADIETAGFGVATNLGLNAVELEFIDPTVACVRTFLGWREALDLAMRIAATVMRLRIATT
jgi:hypothetical protein